jgi:hypothetical protein
MPRRSLKKSLGRLTLALACVGVLWACNAPFIPVPPPAASFTAELLTDNAGGQKTVWITNGHPGTQAASAKFFIYDDNAGDGVIVRANPDGSYQAPPFNGTANDHVFIYYQDDAGDYSEADCRVLMDNVDPAPLCPQ